jgi:NAD(P)H-hydrate epimerase
MRYVVTPQEMAALDDRTIHTIGIPGAVLMERAALAVAEHVRRAYPGRTVVVACGPGNNGGDGFAIARILHLWGVRTQCYAPHGRHKGDAQIHRNAAGNAGVRFLNNKEEFQQASADTGVVVDALFGTGLCRTLEGEWAGAVDAINAAGKPVVAVDIPSGIHGETGKILGTAVRAHSTVTFQYAKTGLYLYPGREYAGLLVIADIGVMADAALLSPRRVWERADAQFPARLADSHKGSYGHVAVIAGSMGMLGAGALAARASVRGGAGLTTWIVPQSLAIPASSLVTEAMIAPVPDESGKLTERSFFAVQEALKGKTTAVLGPGLSRNEGTVALIRHILNDIDIPMVLDADGLFAVSGYPARFEGKSRILTPHPGEMARLLGCGIAEVEADRMGAVRRCAAIYDCTAVLKGATSLIATGEELAFNLTGNPGMATGGSGDVLAGLAGALLAQGYPPYEAACRACWLHGRAGDIAAGRQGAVAMAAGDIVESLPMAAGGDRPD